MRVTADCMAKPALTAIMDTGAEFSSVSRDIVTAAGLRIHPIDGHTTTHIGGADVKMATKRTGWVDMTITVAFPCEPKRRTVSFSKHFEVLDHTEDFIFGNELSQLLFPGNALSAYGATKSIITDHPRNVTYPQQAAAVAQPAAAVARAIGAVTVDDNTDACINADDQREAARDEAAEAEGAPAPSGTALSELASAASSSSSQPMAATIRTMSVAEEKQQ